MREERYDIGYIDERGDMRGDMIERVEKGERNRGEKRERKKERGEKRESEERDVGERRKEMEEK